MLIFSLFQINVNELEFWNYSIENLKEEEKLCTYPPRFQITIKYLEEHCKNLDIEFKIILETDGVLASDDTLKFPLPIILKSTRGVRLGNSVIFKVSYTAVKY